MLNDDESSWWLVKVLGAGKHNVVSKALTLRRAIVAAYLPDLPYDAVWALQMCLLNTEDVYDFTVWYSLFSESCYSDIV